MNGAPGRLHTLLGETAAAWGSGEVRSAGAIAPLCGESAFAPAALLLKAASLGRLDMCCG